MMRKVTKGSAVGVTVVQERTMDLDFAYHYGADEDSLLMLLEITLKIWEVTQGKVRSCTPEQEKEWLDCIMFH